MDGQELMCVSPNLPPTARLSVGYAFYLKNLKRWEILPEKQHIERNAICVESSVTVQL
jgi:hypothetical protein